MEIHPPTKPIESVKDFFLHLSMITIGILIALGLEQAVEAWHHHELGVEARENILNEIRDNKREIDGEGILIKQDKEKLQHTLDTLRQFLAHKKLTHAEISIVTNAANLNSTSWTTASATGALSYMSYAEVKKLAKVYDVQALLQRVQDDQFKTGANALTPVVYAADGPPSLSDDQLRTAETGVLNCLAGLTVWEQIASQLAAEYDRALKP